MIDLSQADRQISQSVYSLTKVSIFNYSSRRLPSRQFVRLVRVSDTHRDHLAVQLVSSMQLGYQHSVHFSVLLSSQLVSQTQLCYQFSQGINLAKVQLPEQLVSLLVTSGRQFSFLDQKVNTLGDFSQLFQFSFFTRVKVAVYFNTFSFQFGRYKLLELYGCTSL